MQETDFWDPTFFHHVQMGLLITISYKRHVDLRTMIH